MVLFEFKNLDSIDLFCLFLLSFPILNSYFFSFLLVIFFSQFVPGVSVGVQGFQGKFQDWKNGSQVIVLNSMFWSKTQLLKNGFKSFGV